MLSHPADLSSSQLREPQRNQTAHNSKEAAETKFTMKTCVGLQRASTPDRKGCLAEMPTWFATFYNQEHTEWETELNELSCLSPSTSSTLKPPPMCMSALFFISRDITQLTEVPVPVLSPYQISKFFLLPNSHKKLFLDPLLVIAKNERSTVPAGISHTHLLKPQPFLPSPITNILSFS